MAEPFYTDDLVTGLFALPELPFDATGLKDDVATDLAVGTAAEHLVCADLLLLGWRAFLADQNCPYDVAVEVRRRLVRVQVKSTRHPRPIPQRAVNTPGYLFHVRRAGKGGRRTYGPAEFDLLALVGLDIRRIAYMPPSGLATVVHIRPPGVRSGRHFDDYPFDRALMEVLS